MPLGGGRRGDVACASVSTHTTPGPSRDEDVPAYLEALGLPGLLDVHVHFLPPSMQQKVWAYFDEAETHYGEPWPVTYRFEEAQRLETLRSLGLRAIPALSYPHKPGMAEWLNAWSADFARRVPDSVHCATFYPEPRVGDYVEAAIGAGARLFKMHVQARLRVGRARGSGTPRRHPCWIGAVAWAVHRTGRRPRGAAAPPRPRARHRPPGDA